MRLFAIDGITVEMKIVQGVGLTERQAVSGLPSFSFGRETESNNSMSRLASIP